MHGLSRFSPSAIPPRRLIVAACLLLCGAMGGAAGADDPRSAQRAEFQRAWTQLASPPSAPAAAATPDSKALERYVLFPWLQAARLERVLGAAGTQFPAALDEQIAVFLRAQDGEPVSQGLRRAWLTSLASRSRWQDFLAFHREGSDGAALRCLGHAARIELGQATDLTDAVIQSWLTPRSVPECERAFTWLETSGSLSPGLVEQRVRLALEAGNASFARQIAARLPREQAAPLLRWAALLENPQREIDALIASPQTEVETAALLAGWSKLARADRTAGKARLDRLIRARQLDRRAASPFALALALPLSWDRDPETLAYFARVEATDFDDTAREWQARAALWVGEWKQAGRSIAAMTESTRQSARWRYWSARAAAQDGDEAGARRLYESILKDDNYYSAMAAARLARTIAPNPQPLPADAALLRTIESQPAFVRARELLLTGIAEPARAEWRHGHSLLPPASRPQAIHLASRWGWHQQAVATATEERVFNDYALLYPRPYDPEVAVAARNAGLPEELVYAVIRQESLYQADAVSSAGARGLMQMLLETARRTARQWQQPAPTATTLFDPATNVLLGAAHVKELLDRFHGQLPAALAGYNAGPGAAQRWLPAQALDPDIWIENIPYNETRAYVQRILWHSVVFSWQRNGEAQDTRSWLQPVQASCCAR